MKKLLQILGLMLAFTGMSAYATPLKADISSEHIPQGTVIAVKTVDYADSSRSEEDDRFDVMTLADIVASDKMVLPKGTVIRGSVKGIMPKRMLSKDAVIYVTFDHLVTPNGTQVPVQTALHSAANLTKDGGLGYGGNYKTASKQNVDNSKKIIVNMTKWGITTGDKTQMPWPKYILTPISATLSVPCAGVYIIGDQIVDLFKKGNEYAINQGEVINLMFLQGVDIPTN